MKHFFYVFLISLISSTFSYGQSADRQNYERHWEDGYKKVRIISYNIFNGFDWRKDLEREARFVDWIRKQDPEVLALQELCGFTQESLCTLAKQWGHPYVAIVKENGYPVGLTSKKPIIVKAKYIEGYGHGLLHAQTYGYDILVTHLNPGERRKRHMEAENIVEYIKNNGLSQCLLMGDMNAHSPFDADYMEQNATELRVRNSGISSANLLDDDFDFSVIAKFISYPLIDVCWRYTLPSERTTFPTPILMSIPKHKEIRKRVEERLDYIFVTPELCKKEVVDACIFSEVETDFLSDHYPIGVDLLTKMKE